MLRLIFSIYLLYSAQAFAGLDFKDPVIHQWLQFMGYNPEATPGTYQSPVTKLAFFMDQNGAKDAEAELKTTVQIFSEVRASSDKHPQCVFPARYEILKKKFSLAPPVTCPNFDAWRKNYEITGVNVLYGSQYISTPTSAFGHSFFVIDSERTLEYARTTFNYGAEIPADVGASLVWDGLFGGFRGTYSVVPLYHRLHSYNDIENRDIWEYRIALSPEERDLLVKYLWEVQDKFEAPYYFLTGNCASAILEMLNVIRPGLELKTSSPLYTSPQEIFRVLDRNGLIASVKYRPSLEKQLSEKLESLSSHQISQFKDAVKGEAQVPNDPLLAETLMSFIQLQRQKNQAVTPESLKELEKKTLLVRAQMPEAKVFEVPRARWPEAPHQAQGPNLIGFGRVHKDKVGMTRLIFRPAFHDLMQTDAGFLTNSAIDVLALEARVPDGKDLHLEQLTLGRIANFRERKIYDPLATSWVFEGKYQRNPFAEVSDQYFSAIAADVGFGESWFHPSLLFFALAGVELRDGSMDPFGKASVGPRLGVIGSFGRFKVYSYYQVHWQSQEAVTWQTRKSEFKLRYNLNQSWDLLAEYSAVETARRELVSDEAGLSARLSF